jgi:hypothetical protein
MATTSTGHMNILDDCPGKGYKLCRKNLHWYLPGRGCLNCRNIQSNANYHKKAAEGNAWHQLNKEKHNLIGREQYKKNQEARKEKWRKWREANIAHDRKRNQQYGQKQKDIVRRKAAKRRANKKTQTPVWANIQEINRIYKECPKGFHVDHIYPLKSKYMCGLHVENNLQIISATENICKGNRSWPGQLDCQKLSVYDIFDKELTNLLNG